MRSPADPSSSSWLLLAASKRNNLLLREDWNHCCCYWVAGGPGSKLNTRSSTCSPTSWMVHRVLPLVLRLVPLASSQPDTTSGCKENSHGWLSNDSCYSHQEPLSHM